MKRTLIFVLALFAHTAFSQKISSYAKKMDNLLQNIDKSQAKTGILYDRAIGQANLRTFNNAENNTSSSTHWKQARYELQLASDKNNFEEFSQILLSKKAVDIIPIGIIDANINYIDTLLLSQKSHDAPYMQSKAGEVIKTKNVFVASLLNDKDFVLGKTYNFEFSKDFYLQNNSKEVASIELSFLNEDKKVSITPPQL